MKCICIICKIRYNHKKGFDEVAGEKYPVGDVQFDGNGTGPFRGGRFSDRELAGRMARNRPLVAAGLWCGWDHCRISQHLPAFEKSANRTTRGRIRKMSEENQTSKNQDNHSSPTSTMEETPEIPEESPSDQVRTLYTILLTVSGILILLAGILKLDYLLGVFLGCSVVGLNFHWTVVFVRNLIHDKKVQPLNLIFYLTKFAISALVLFGALNYFEIPPLGLIIGLSNILLAVVAYSVINSMKRDPVQEPEENKE